MITLTPIPRRCEWVGPFENNTSCSGCNLGYEESDADPDLCVKPPFRPWKQWSKTKSAAYRELAGTTFGDTLYLDKTYETGPVALKPKHEKFVGYFGDYNQITYELDFTAGAQVRYRCMHPTYLPYTHRHLRAYTLSPHSI